MKEDQRDNSGMNILEYDLNSHPRGIMEDAGQKKRIHSLRARDDFHQKDDDPSRVFFIFYLHRWNSHIYTILNMAI